VVFSGADFLKEPFPSAAQPTNIFRSISQSVLASHSRIQNPRCPPTWILGGTGIRKEPNGPYYFCDPIISDLKKN
jgi:hypothetical protein